MAFPTSDVSTAHLDSATRTGDPAAARADLLDLVEKFNALRNHVSTFVRTILDDADASAMLTTLGVSTFAKTLLDDADNTAARATLGAASSGANAWTAGQAGTPRALPATTGAVTLDLEQANNWAGTLSGNITLANPSSQPVGQSGTLALKQDATGGRTVAFGTAFDFDGPVPSAPTAANAVFSVHYYVREAGVIEARMTGALA